MIPIVWRIAARAYARAYLGHPDVLVDVRAGVWPVAPGHQVGVIWSIDDWARSQVGQAHWTSNIPNAFGSEDETWYFEVERFPAISPLYFRYVLFVDNASGHRVWDNNGGWNYELRIY